MCRACSAERRSAKGALREPGLAQEATQQGLAVMDEVSLVVKSSLLGVVHSVPCHTVIVNVPQVSMTNTVEAWQPGAKGAQPHRQQPNSFKGCSPI